MKKFSIRAGVILFWILIICGSLYLPKWKRFQEDKNTINIFVWGGILPPELIENFEKETGIKANLSYYASNEELIVKLKATKAKGYDLIIPSDYAVRILSQEGLLKKIDKQKFAHWAAVNPLLMHHYFDPDNNYSIPFEWEIFGFGIDEDYFLHRPIPSSWKMLFHPQMIPCKIAMNNDPIEAVAFASFYLFGLRSTLSTAQVDQVKEILIQQKPWVTAYANFRGDYFLATKNVPLVLSSTSYIWRAKQFCNFISFITPEEGTFLTIENFCIPAPSKKEDLVFQFINYLSTPSSVVSLYENYFLFPATTHANALLNLDDEARRILNSSKTDFEHYHFVRNILTEKEARDVWVDVKS